ncbi:MAG: bifunctional 4-hydroxy-2-oxoglutarate aldolase/2-dehydro-3-deoxy-phosphogluconate aldolase [Puniceicoccales bacterium]|jgi:2-dehydro-3-deoxyphosphogluconate aldolase/(4S)-4-hydroxy-2-oxoglutarate aldolase|nr:bifunctional 4-hydroxy-2-oxoglutarate aldolase/2-dehydro-3-deoxy-phosphogluconate aldolase [Puniceicoccales bacterium]
MSANNLSSPLAELARLRLLPILTLNDPALAGPLAQALLNGGLPCVELTLRTPRALESVKVLASRGDLLVGAGTIRTVENARAAVEAGAKFLVSPACVPDVLAWCRDNGVPLTPGCVTPSEIELAIAHGCEVVKFFPASNFGGPSTLKAYAAPLPNVRFIPTGGISQKTLPEYLALKNVLAVGGGWFAPADDLQNNRFSEIEQRVRTAVEIAATISSIS